MSPEDTYLGRFIGVQAISKEKYRVVVLDTIGNNVVRVEDITRSGTGIEGYQAFAKVSYSLSSHLRSIVPRLWRLNPFFNGLENAKRELENLKSSILMLKSQRDRELDSSLIEKFVQDLEMSLTEQKTENAVSQNADQEDKQKES